MRQEHTQTLLAKVPAVRASLRFSWLCSTGTLQMQKDDYDSTSCIPCTLYPTTKNRDLCYKQVMDKGGYYANFGGGWPEIPFTAYRTWRRVLNPPKLWE